MLQASLCVEKTEQKQIVPTVLQVLLNGIVFKTLVLTLADWKTMASAETNMLEYA